jgi:Pyruvate/2-oxoacid:ferredoxin oxidoreductase delta subunit
MTALGAPSLRIIIYEGAGSRPLAAADRFEVVQNLLDKGYAVTSAKAGGAVAPQHSAASILVLGRFAEAPPAEAAEAVESKSTVLFRDIDGLTGAGIVDLVERTGLDAHIPKPGGWKPWFPVIDYSRCTNCMQCLTFCLFGVYGVDKERKIQVQTPSNCKTDCPACSRVCPEVAILFPKYKSGPINGDEVNAVDIEREKMKVDISALLGGDIYSALRQRSEHARSRFAKERDEKRALDERKRCLTKLQAALDIPSEVLAALPSAEDIQRRAAIAIAAAERRES